MRSILQFPEDERPARGSAPLGFIALISAQARPEDLQTLSPRLMQWDSDLWLLDLRPCLSYWQLQSQAQQKTLPQILQQTIESFAAPGTYTAALCSQAWQALLLARLLEKKRFYGLSSQTQRLSHNLLSALSWDIWWLCAERYHFHSQAKSKTATFPKQKRAMQVAMRRLCCDTPAQLKNMPSSQIKRRFGPLIADLWEQTFPPPMASPSSWSLEEAATFPWQSYILTKPLTHTRHLDFPLSDWQVLEDFLREDLNLLCLLDSFKKGERILNLEWRIVLENLQEIPISVLFRHPHCLQHESPHQRTALLQILYAFQRTQRARSQEQNTEVPWIVSWELRVLETFRPQAEQNCLFAERTAAWDELLTLENQLERPLEAYQILDDWLPEDAFTSVHTPAVFEREYLPALEHLGRHRPLFLLRQPQLISFHGQSQLWKFRERTMDKWWRHQQGNTVRDYYQVVKQEQMLWVFRDAKGQCFLHGVYG